MAKGVILDMDNCIIDSEELYFQSWNDTIAPKKIARVYWFSTFPGTGMHNVVRTSIAELDLKEDEEYWIRKWKRHYKALLKQGVTFTKGFRRFNRQLDKAGLKKIIATGSDRGLAKLALRQAGLNNQFDVVDCEGLAYCKPHPEVFKRAARKLDLDPHDCVVFEDAIAGIKAAKRAHAKVIALTTTYDRQTLEQHNPHYIIDDFTQISAEKLKRW